MATEEFQLKRLCSRFGGFVVGCCVLLTMNAPTFGQSQETLVSSQGVAQVGRLIGASNDGLTFLSGGEKQNLSFGAIAELKFDNETISLDPAAAQFGLQLVDGSEITLRTLETVSYTHLTLPTTPYV